MNELMNEWTDEWMNEQQNENESSKAWKVIGMKKDDRIGRFERLKRLRSQQTDRQTYGHYLLWKCEDAL